MLTRREFNKLLLTSIFLPSFGCIKKENYKNGILRLNLGYEPDTLDWLQATDSYSFDVISNIMVGLTKYNNKLESVPSLAKKWDISNGNKTYTFYLDEDAKWIDEKPVLASDFYFAWEKILNPKTAGAYAYLLYPIKNAEAYNTGKIKDKSLLGIKVLNDFTFQVELEKPLAFFINLTSYCFTFPQRKDIVEKYGNNWTEPKNIITCGPFKLNTWNHEYKITLVKNLNYFPVPNLNEIKYFIVPEQSSAFSLYLNNELDWIDKRSIPISEINTIKKMKDTQFHPLLRGSYIGFNVYKKPFDNKLVRAAFSHAIDRNIFPKILGRGEVPVTSWIPPGLENFYSSDIGLEFNPEKARTLLHAAGYKDGKNFPLVQLLYPTRDDVKLIVEAIQASFKKILNVEIELINEEWKTYLATLNNNPPHLFRANWGADYPDPDTFMNLFSSSSGNNYSKWKNLTYDSYIQEAASILDIEKRKILYRSAEKILLEEDVVIAPIFVDTQITMQKPWVKNIEFNSMDLMFAEKIIVE